MLKRISSGKTMHDPETLNAILKDRGNPLPLVFVEKLRKSGWSTDLRYESGRRDTEKTRGFVETAKEVFDWVEGQLP